MIEDLERRLRTSLSGAALPSAPDSLHEALDRLPDDAGPIGTGRASRSAGVLLAITAAVVLALFAVWLLPGALPGPAAPSASVGASSSPTPRLSSDPSTTPEPSAALMQVTLPLGSGHSLILTIRDESGQLRGVRAATSVELVDRPVPVDTLVYNPGGQPSSQVRLVWGGVICDTAATLAIGPDIRTWTLTDGPHPPCDTSNSVRGVVLTFAQPTDAASVALTHHQGQIQWPEVTEYGVIDSNTGWSVVGGRLRSTHDGGASWSVKAPLAWPALAFGDIGFTDASHGWGLNLASPSQPLFERTADGGATWSAAALPSLGTPSLPFFFDRLDADLLMSSSPAGKSGSLLRTRDGGATWSQVATVPAGLLGPIEFSDAANGYAVGTTQPIAPIVPDRDALFATHDGGQTWSQATIPVPAGFGAVTSADVNRLPVITGPESAVALVGLTSATKSATEALVTTDAGRTWAISASLPADESAIPFAVLSTGRWVAAFAPDGVSMPTLMESLDGWRTWSPVGAVGIPTNGAIHSFTWADSSHGWALVDTYSDASQPEDVPGQLYATSDGGATWSDITPSQ